MFFGALFSNWYVYIACFRDCSFFVALYKENPRYQIVIQVLAIMFILTKHCNRNKDSAFCGISEADPEWVLEYDEQPLNFQSGDFSALYYTVWCITHVFKIFWVTFPPNSPRGYDGRCSYAATFISSAPPLFFSASATARFDVWRQYPCRSCIFLVTLLTAELFYIYVYYNMISGSLFCPLR